MDFRLGLLVSAKVIKGFRNREMMAICWLLGGYEITPRGYSPVDRDGTSSKTNRPDMTVIAPCHLSAFPCFHVSTVDVCFAATDYCDTSETLSELYMIMMRAVG